MWYALVEKLYSTYSTTSRYIYLAKSYDDGKTWRAYRMWHDVSKDKKIIPWNFGFKDKPVYEYPNVNNAFGIWTGLLEEDSNNKINVLCIYKN